MARRPVERPVVVGNLALDRPVDSVEGGLDPEAHGHLLVGAGQPRHHADRVNPAEVDLEPCIRRSDGGPPAGAGVAVDHVAGQFGPERRGCGPSLRLDLAKPAGLHPEAGQERPEGRFFPIEPDPGRGQTLHEPGEHRSRREIPHTRRSVHARRTYGVVGKIEVRHRDATAAGEVENIWVVRVDGREAVLGQVGGDSRRALERRTPRPPGLQRAKLRIRHHSRRALDQDKCHARQSCPCEVTARHPRHRTAE